MRWRTAYSGSNNLHFNFPPIMDNTSAVFIPRVLVHIGGGKK